MHIIQQKWYISIDNKQFVIIIILLSIIDSIKLFPIRFIYSVFVIILRYLSCNIQVNWYKLIYLKEFFNKKDIHPYAWKCPDHAFTQHFITIKAYFVPAINQFPFMVFQIWSTNNQFHCLFSKASNTVYF